MSLEMVYQEYQQSERLVSQVEEFFERLPLPDWSKMRLHIGPDRKASLVAEDWLGRVKVVPIPERVMRDRESILSELVGLIEASFPPLDALDVWREGCEG